MSVLEQRVWRTVTGAHVPDGHVDADVLAYAAGDDVPDEIVAELGDTVTVAPAPEPVSDPEPEPVAPSRGSRVRVFRTEDGRHVRAGHRDAAVLAYTEEDDVPDDVLGELDAPVEEPPVEEPPVEEPPVEEPPVEEPPAEEPPAEEPPAEEPPAEEPPAEEKAAPASANKSRRPAGNKRA